MNGMELEEAEELYAKAKEQIAKWGQHPESSFARDQVEMWEEILDSVCWVEPGASSSGVKR